MRWAGSGVKENKWSQRGTLCGQWWQMMWIEELAWIICPFVPEVQRKNRKGHRGGLPWLRSQRVSGRGRIWTWVSVTLECASSPVVWPGQLCWAPRGSPGPGREWWNHCLAKAIPALSSGLQVGRGGSGTEGSLAPWPRAALPISTHPPPAGLFLPSWASVWALEPHRLGYEAHLVMWLGLSSSSLCASVFTSRACP